MTQEHKPVAQWTLDVTTWHDAKFGHRVTARVLGRSGGWLDCGSWHWKGIGVPAELLVDLQTRVTAVIGEHLMTRYGIQGTLPLAWKDGQDPF